MSICNAKKMIFLIRIINPYTQDIRITNPNGRNGRTFETLSISYLTAR